MRAPITGNTGDAGEHYVAGDFVDQLGWGACSVSKGDLGTDLWLMARDVSGFDLGALVGVQVKTGDSYFKEEKRGSRGELIGWWFRANAEHFDYWRDHSVPHIVVLYDLKSHKSYWAHISRENTQSTGKDYKLLVPITSLVNEKHREELTLIALAGRKAGSWEGSAWSAEEQISSSAMLRCSLMVPRLIAPHRNQGLKAVNAYQAIAILSQLRLQSLRQLKEGPLNLDAELLSKSSEWEWRFFAAIHAWLLVDKTVLLDACYESADTPDQRAAAVVCIALTKIEAGESVQAIKLLTSELKKSDMNGLDRGWLQAHLTQCYLENGSIDEAVKLAIQVYGLRNTATADPSSDALVASASYTLFFENNDDETNLKNAVQGNDTASSWWRSGVIASGFNQENDIAFKKWSEDKGYTSYMQDGAWEAFRSVMFQSNLSTHRADWANSARKLARRDLMRGRKHELVASSIKLLRQSSAVKDLILTLPKILKSGPVSAITEAGTALDLNISTRSTLHSDLTLIQLAADVLPRSVSDRHARWGLEALIESNELKNSLSKRFSVDVAIVDMLCAIVRSSSVCVQLEIAEYVLKLPAVTDRSFAGSLKHLIASIPSTVWTTDAIAVLVARNNIDHPKFKEALELLLSLRDAGTRELLLSRFASGDLESLPSYGDVSDIPTDVAAKIITHSAKSLEQQILQLKKRCDAWHESGFLGTLVLLNIWHPTVADWTSVVVGMSESTMPARDLHEPVGLIVDVAGAVPEHVREEVSLCLDKISKRPNMLATSHPFDSRDIRHSALIALSQLNPNTTPVADLRMLVISQRWFKRAAAVHVIVRQADDWQSNITALFLLAKDSNEIVRQAAITGLATWAIDEIGLPDSENFISDRIQSGIPIYALWASQALGESALKTETGGRLLEIFLNDASLTVRTRAKNVLKDATNVGKKGSS